MFPNKMGPPPPPPGMGGGPGSGRGPDLGVLLGGGMGSDLGGGGDFEGRLRTLHEQLMALAAEAGIDLMGPPAGPVPLGGPPGMGGMDAPFMGGMPPLPPGMGGR